MEVNCFVENNPLVEILISHLARSPRRFLSKIAADDEMFLYQFGEFEDRNFDLALTGYYSLGRRLFDAVEQIVKYYFGSFERVSSFLDFACGYGRLMRFLVQEMPPEKIWASDIYADAVRFQAEYFGVNGIVSAYHPNDYQIDQKFDCIYAGSFFSHMPPPAFKLWMERLYHLLNPEGLLIFSVLDETTLPPFTPMPPAGILFSSKDSESRFLDRNDYGTTYVNESFIRELIDKITQNKAPIYRIKKGLGNYQDLYLVAPNSARDFGNFNFNYHPEGYLDNCNIAPTGEVQLEGWAVDLNPQGGVETVQIVVNNSVVQECRPSRERPDLAEHFNAPDAPNAGWNFVSNCGQISPQDVVLIKAKNAAGLEAIIAAETLKNLMYRTGWRRELTATRSELHRCKTELEKTQSQLEFAEFTLAQAREKLTKLETELGESQFKLASSEFLLEQLNREIQGMKSSKFWKMRGGWFKLRRNFERFIKP